MGSNPASDSSYFIGALDESLISKQLKEVTENLVIAGFCDAQDLERGESLAIEENQRIDLVLVTTGIVTESELAYAYSKALDMPLVNTADYPTTPMLLERLQPSFLKANRICPLLIEAGELVLAVVDGLDKFVPRTVAAAIEMPVQLRIAIPAELDAALESLYTADARQFTDVPELPHQNVGDDVDRLKDIASEAPIIRLLASLIGRAVETKATDIHIEAVYKGTRVRFRYDGVLQDAGSYSKDVGTALISRVKILAKLDIAERRLPQDGRFQFVVRGSPVDFRVSTTPSHAGEGAVLRVLDRSAIAFDYGKLGLPYDLVSKWTKALAQPNGILLVTGPTGSGKTTTLYTALSSLNDMSRKIVTIEDPVEFELSGVNQLQVKSQINLNFASLLRSVLRQDPDIIMVGEIRDLETAHVAAQAALTGHLVLSTLHTNSAVATLMRLLDMGIEQYLIAEVLRTVIAQRLVRRLCDDCKQQVDVGKDTVQSYGLERFSSISEIRLWKPVGCRHCRSTGYRGRLVVAEMLECSEEVRDLMRRRADEDCLNEAALRAGLVPMRDMGIQAVLRGETTIQELLKHLYIPQ